MDDQAQIRLTPTSYIVLGMLEAAGAATPYALKAMVAESVGYVWTVQHAQLYSEPERLAGAGLVAEEREDGGRRRRTYSLTETGRRALEQWRAAPAGGTTELRDIGLLQLFFGADPAAVAAAQLPGHEARLAAYEEIRSRPGEPMPPGPSLALDAGIAHEREWVRFWRGVSERGR
jgi:DNA-binding PadR family transcriptional regulator